MVQSLSNPSDTGYTDAISIKGEAEYAQYLRCG